MYSGVSCDGESDGSRIGEKIDDIVIDGRGKCWCDLTTIDCEAR